MRARACVYVCVCASARMRACARTLLCACMHAYVNAYLNTDVYHFFMCIVYCFPFCTEVFEQALAVGFTAADDYIQLWKAYCDYLRRRIDWSDISKRLVGTVDIDRPVAGSVTVVLTRREERTV